MSYSPSYKRNITLFYLYEAGRASLFFMSIWIAYQELFLSFTQIAFFVALIQICVVVFELPTGVLADLISRKLSMILGLAIMGLAYLFVLSRSVDLMYLYALLYGLGLSMISGADKALLYDTLKTMGEEKRYPAVAATGSFIFQLVGSLAIMLGGYMYTYNINLPYLARALTLFVTIIPVLLMKEPTIDSYKFSLRNYLRHIKEGVALAFSNAYMVALSIFYILMGAIAFVNHRFLAQKFMMEIRWDAQERAIITSLIKFSVALITLLIGRHKKLVHTKHFLILLPLIMVISLLPIRYAAGFLAVLALWGVAIPAGTRNIFVGYFLQRAIDSKYRATVLSATNMLTSLLYALLSYIVSKFIITASTGEYYQKAGLFTLIILMPLAFYIISKSNHSGR